MRLHRRAAATVPALAALALLAPLPASAAPTAGVTIADQTTDSACGSYSYCFDPATVHVDVGGTVTWTSHSQAPHTVTGDDGSWSSGTTDLTVGQSYAHTFPTAGTFTYHCNVHRYMTGTVVVGSGSPPSTQPPPSKPPVTQAPTAAPTVRPATTQAPASAAPPLAPATAPPTAAPLAQAPATSAPAATPAPSPTGALPTGVATTPPSGGGGGAGPVIAVVAAFVAAGAAGTWWVRRRRSVFTKIH
jgi:plastocyanin